MACAGWGAAGGAAWSRESRTTTIGCGDAEGGAPGERRRDARPGRPEEAAIAVCRYWAAEGPNAFLSLRRMAGDARGEASKQLPEAHRRPENPPAPLQPRSVPRGSVIRGQEGHPGRAARGGGTNPWTRSILE